MILIRLCFHCCYRCCYRRCYRFSNRRCERFCSTTQATAKNVVIALSLVVFSAFIQAQSSDELDAALAKIEDKNLLACIEKLAAKHAWGSPSDVTKLSCHNANIERLDGLEAFNNLHKLSLFKNNISQVPLPLLTLFPELRSLNLARNQLTEFRLADLPKLKELYLFDNQVKQLTLSNLTSLQKLKANSNGLTQFSYTNLPALNKVYLFDNDMEDINFASLPKLKYMDVRQNPMPDELYERMDKRVGTTILHDGNADDWD